MFDNDPELKKIEQHVSRMSLDRLDDELSTSAISSVLLMKMDYR